MRYVMNYSDYKGSGLLSRHRPLEAARDDDAARAEAGQWIEQNSGRGEYGKLTLTGLQRVRGGKYKYIPLKA